MSDGWEFLQRVCPLCGYTMGKHIVPGAGSPLHNETTGLGVLCPTDSRLVANEALKESAHPNEVRNGK